MVQAAVRTTASPAAIWVICAVAVLCLVFWLSMVMVVANRPVVRHRRFADLPGPVLGGMHLAQGGRSVAPTRDAPAVLEDFGTAGVTPAPDTAAGQPGRPRVPAQRGPEAPAQPVPAQGPAPAREDAAAEAPAEPVPAQRTAAHGTAPADTAGSGAAGQS
jgi:hypothetical protein